MCMIPFSDLSPLETKGKKEHHGKDFQTCLKVLTPSGARHVLVPLQISEWIIKELCNTLRSDNNFRAPVLRWPLKNGSTFLNSIDI